MDKIAKQQINALCTLLEKNAADQGLEPPDTEGFREWMSKEAEIKTPEQFKRDRQKELQLLQTYKKNPGAETFTPLYQSFKNLVMKAAQKNMHGSPIPRAAHIAFAAQSFLDATRTHNPSLAPFHIHVYNTVENKGKRLNYKYQNIGYIPEARATKYQTFNTTVNLLKEELGREPATQEISDEIGWSPKMVETMRKEVRKDLVMDEMKAEAFSQGRSNKANQMLYDIMPSLITQHQVVLEHAAGLSGRPALTKPGGGADKRAIAKATGLAPNIVDSAMKTISRKVRSYQGGISGVNFIDED